MKNVIITMLLLFCGITAANAQTDKAEKIKQIREAYATAKNEIAENGKNGNPALDMRVSFHTSTEVDEDFTIDDDIDINYYFFQKRRYNAKEETFHDENVCFFIIENWSANGHTRYREMLYDRSTEKLIFSFTRSESHAGFVVETRYYFDESGKVIEEKLKVAGEEQDPSDHLYGEAKDEWGVSDRYMHIFQEIMEPRGDYSASDGTGAVTPKDERMKFIRAQYADARSRMEKDKENNTCSMSIVVHDQEEGVCPPEETIIQFSMSEWDDGQALMYRCYFITERCHHYDMGYNLYSEYLLDPEAQRFGSDEKKPAKTVNPLFSYTRVHEEGEQYEWRYYFDENGRCIETKSNHEETDGGQADKLKTRRLLHIFNTIANQQ